MHKEPGTIGIEPDDEEVKKKTEKKNSDEDTSGEEDSALEMDMKVERKEDAKNAKSERRQQQKISSAHSSLKKQRHVKRVST